MTFLKFWTKDCSNPSNFFKASGVVVSVALQVHGRSKKKQKKHNSEKKGQCFIEAKFNLCFLFMCCEYLSIIHYYTGYSILSKFRGQTKWPSQDVTLFRQLPSSQCEHVMRASGIRQPRRPSATEWAGGSEIVMEVPK